MKNVLLFAALLSITIQGQSQKTVPYFGKINWVNGFVKEISGESLTYFSAFPDYATTALLTRASDGNKTIEWETAPVPSNIKGPYVYFSWVAGHSSGTSSGNRNFDLYVNGEKLLTFTTLPAHQNPIWTYGAADSSRIVFQQTKRDGANDAHGLVYLRLPVSKVRAGEPVRLKITGQAQNSADWFMTFKFSFEEKVDVNPMPFLLKDGHQPVVLTALHFGNDQQLKVKVNNKTTYTFTVKDGVNNFDIPVNAVQKPDSVFINIASGKNVLVNRYVPLKPVVYRELDFIHHSHTDIGYSHMQPEVMRIHLKNIDDALRMIEKTKNYPAEAKFKWNIESAWAVENWLKQADAASKERFVAAVKAGSICLSGLYANILTGASEPEEVFHYTDYAAQLRKEYGFTINSAMISDIPGFAWTTVTGLSKGGIKYFSSGPNFLGENHPYWGDRAGHFVKTWGDKPVWWASPSGEEKLLFWAGAKGYSSWHGTAPGGIFDRGTKKIAAYLDELTENNYPYELVQWRYNVVSDNGPIDSTISDFVKQWNEKYSSPKIVLNTTQKLFETFENKYGNALPVVKGDITPYWEDGAWSTADEEGKNRINSLRLQQLTTLYSMLNPAAYDPKKFYEAWTNIIMFHEHTWGAHNSTTEPDVPFVTEQWRIKKQFMLDAARQANELAQSLLTPLNDPQSNKIAVFNTLSWKRSGPVMIAKAGNYKSVKDAAGKKYPLQPLSNGNAVFIAGEVPALGSQIFELSTEEVTSLSSPFVITDSTISNSKVSVGWNKNNGSITQLNAGNIFNYAGDYRNQGLNSYWYVPGLDPAAAQTNKEVKITVIEKGPVVTTVTIASDAPGGNQLNRNISLYANEDEVALENRLDKKAIRDKEAVHFGFPFNESLVRTTLDAGYGSFDYMAGQLPGSNMDYICARRWMDASAAGKGIQMLMLETPMVEPGNMIDERKTIQGAHKEWKKEGTPTASWFSYVMNNYWHTNYKADQSGVTQFRYALRPHGIFNTGENEKTAAAFTQPLVVLPVKDGTNLPGQPFELTNNRVVVTSITPAENGELVIRLFNPEQAVEQTGFVWKSFKPSGMAIINSGDQKHPADEIKLAAMGVMEIRLIK